MKDSFASFGIPVLVMAFAVLAFNSAGFSVAMGVIAFVLALALSSQRGASRRAKNRPRLVRFVGVALLLLAVGYLNWGIWVLTGSPTEWPRHWPYPDQLMILIHESMQSPSVMPFDNKQTLLALGALITCLTACAGWLLGSTSTGSALCRPWVTKKSSRQLYYQSTLWSISGLAIGLFPAVMFGKALPIALLLIPLGTFVGAGYATSKASGLPE